jgi:enoyl-CoA hydratase
MTEEKEFNTLSCHRDTAIATITLHRPEALNALNTAMFDDLERVFAELAGHASVRAILLTGSGDRAFCAGADIRQLVGTNAFSGKEISVRGQQVFTKIERCGKPVIACVNGAALGGGCELALACTLRLASDTAKFAMPEARLGLIPGYGGTQRLPRLIGRGAALRMMLSAQTIDAAEALRIGLVEEVAPSADLMQRARELAGTISTMAPLALRGVLDAVEQGENKSLEEGLQAEAKIFGRLCGTRDKHEGLTAFLERRPATWQNK